jgi:DNA-binding NtrC family response regulator
MALARLVVIEGPDIGCQFTIPPAGGGVGRGEGNAVQLSDLAVSRIHCTIEPRGDELVLVDAGSRNRTLVNGQPVGEHPLREGDEIAIGKTRLAYIPAEGGVALLRQPVPSRVTIEIGSGALRGAVAAGAVAGAGEQRARRYLAAIAGLGDRLRELEDGATAARATCDATLHALGAERALLLLREAGGRLAAAAAAVRTGDGAGAQLSLPPELVAKVLDEGKAVAAVLPEAGQHRAALAAPLTGRGGQARGLLFADRSGVVEWEELDLLALGSLAHVSSASLSGLESRQALERENRELRATGVGEFVGSSPEAGAVLRFIDKVAPADATVLLTGESGSGKEMVARAIHQASRRARQAFVAVNCAALTETLLESELFGHEKGAFTGATERKLGRFELADRGTLFLDEVGELPPECQSKFLRVLEEQRFERVGGTRSITVDVRVLAATNRALPELVRTGQFREDLYYRLSVIHIEVPPLRARRGDIAALAEHFLARLRTQVPRRVRGFTPEAMQLLLAHSWPGNVRELRNAIERALVLGEGELITAPDLPPHVGGAGPGWPASGGAITAPAPAPPAVATGAGPPVAAPTAQATAAPQARSLRALEREGIIAALRATGGNKAQAAAVLEIDRSTLYKKLKDYGIEV